MILRFRLEVRSLLLTGTALLTIAGWPAATLAASAGVPLVIAQAASEQEKSKQPAAKKEQPAAKQQQPAAKKEQPAATKQQPAAKKEQPAAKKEQPAAKKQQPAAKTEQPAAKKQQPAANKQQPAAKTEQPAAKTEQPAAQPQQKRAAPAGTEKDTQRQDSQRKEQRQERREERREGRDERREQRRDERQQVPATTQQQKPAQQAPAANTASQPPAAAPSSHPAAVAPPTRSRDASEFIRRRGETSEHSMEHVRRERQEQRQGNRTFIREPGRTIIRDGDRTIIRHNEANRFAIGAGTVRTDRRGGNIETSVQRGNGRIVTVTSPDGRLIRRVRRDARGRDIVIIDNSRAGRRASTVFVQLPPPVIRIPRDRYIVEAWHAPREAIYGVFIAPPVEPVDEVYTVDQVRYSEALRDRMPRVDLDVTFETGSWELTPDQIETLAMVAEGLSRAIKRNPQEVFLIEGHTDAVGSDVDNLSLSDRRAEAVAVALTEQFQVPPENLVTQGYGEQYLKVPTQGDERANRRVSVRRITPLIDRQVSSAPPPR
jgi:outer membrane protein OmpA-like peptidoglycan-associated protein